jgi:hypothetical protein
LVALVLWRWAAWDAELYDAYEFRATARRLLAGTSPNLELLSWRSPLLIWPCAALEAVGLGWKGPALVSVACYALAMGWTAACVRGLGAPRWAAALAAALLASNHLAFVFASHAMAEVPTMAAGAGLLLLVCRGEATDRRAALVGVALGALALLRPNLGPLGLALLAGLPRPWSLRRVAIAGLVSVATFFLVAWLHYAAMAHSLGGGWSALVEGLRYMSDRSAQTVYYGGHAPPLPYLIALLDSGPVLGALAAGGAVVAWRQGPGSAARIVLALAALHLLLCEAWSGIFFARLWVPLLPACAILAALAAQRLVHHVARRWPRRAEQVPTVLVALSLLVSAAWIGPYEVQRLSDPAARRNFAAELASLAAEGAPAEARFAWTTTHPYPVAPAVVRAAPTYPGDPFFSIFCLGPIVLGYHLEQPVSFPQLGGHPGLREPAELLRFVRHAVHGDGSRFRPGDVLLVGLPTPARTWHLRPRPAPFGIGRVVLRDGRLDLDLTWVPHPGEEPADRAPSRD